LGNSYEPCARDKSSGQESVAIVEHVVLAAELPATIAVRILPSLEWILGVHLHFAVQDQVQRTIASREGDAVVIDDLMFP